VQYREEEKKYREKVNQNCRLSEKCFFLILLTTWRVYEYSHAMCILSCQCYKYIYIYDLRKDIVSFKTKAAYLRNVFNKIMSYLDLIKQEKYQFFVYEKENHSI
jgi:hypothetical protein